MPSKTHASDDDPISRALAPPPGETEAEREERLSAERKQKLVSDAIDEEINKQRIAEKKSGKAVKLLLLGQSESGKSTTLKNFQLIHSPDVFNKERASWRAVIQLNVVRSVRHILDAMAEVQQQQNSGSTSSRSGSKPDSTPFQLTSEHLKLKMRLTPLIQVEETLLRRLLPSGATPLDNAAQLSTMTNIPSIDRKRAKEVTINSAMPWKNAFGKLINGMRGSEDTDREIDFEDPEDPGVVLNACCADMQKLWADPMIKRMLQKQRIRLEELAGFFLDSLDRVAAPKYVPSNDDILRARLKTLGVSEHRFRIQGGSSVLSKDWRVFDVGGQRSLVCNRSKFQTVDTQTIIAAWVPYFDDMDAILFLAPISCFDQVLEEDANVNRLEDSVLLWKVVVSHPLLKNTNLILFLNKCDILKSKLESGIRVADYVISYGDRPNDFDSVSNYMRKKFAAIQKEFSARPRQFYCHFTSVTDTKSTSKILADVQEIAVRANLENSSLI